MKKSREYLVKKFYVTYTCELFLLIKNLEFSLFGNIIVVFHVGIDYFGCVRWLSNWFVQVSYFAWRRIRKTKFKCFSNIHNWDMAMVVIGCGSKRKSKESFNWNIYEGFEPLEPPLSLAYVPGSSWQDYKF